MTVTNTQDNVATFKYIATNIHGTAIYAHDAAADLQQTTPHNTHIGEEVCNKNAPLVVGDKIKSNVANDLGPVATELKKKYNYSSPTVTLATNYTFTFQIYIHVMYHW